jgi:hypothetical protein
MPLHHAKAHPASVIRSRCQKEAALSKTTVHANSIDKMMSDTTTPINGTQMLGSTIQAVPNLYSTCPENNNESTLSEDDDDVTVQPSNSKASKQAWKSYNIKLLFTSKQDTSNSALLHAMLTHGLSFSHYKSVLQDKHCTCMDVWMWSLPLEVGFIPDEWKQITDVEILKKSGVYI